MESIDFSLQRLKQVGDAPLKPCPYISKNFDPIPPHKVGIAHLVLKPRFLLADPTGCGKTPQALVAFGFLKERDPNLRLLVMAERSAIYQWHQSVGTFLVDVRPTIVGYNLDSGSSVSRFNRYATYERNDSDVFILSYHQMARDIDVILQNIDNYVVVYDEVQHLKSQKGQSLYPSAQKLSIKGRYVWGMSATPQMNGRLEELHAIMEVIRPGTFGSFESFRARYCNYIESTIRVGGRLRRIEQPNPIEPYKNIPELMKIVRPFFLKRRAEVINKYLPKVVTKEVMLAMLPEQGRLYEDVLSKRFISPTTHKLAHSLGALTYAQLVSDSPETVGVNAESSKMIELLRFLNEEVNDEKVIIYSKFRRTVDFICSRLKTNNTPYVRITGAEKAKQRNDAKLVFNSASSGVNVICINKAGGTSLDLQQASIVIFYDLPWSWGEWDQILGRARRIGSPHEKVLAVILINQGTVDQHALTILRSKESNVDRTIGVDGSALQTDFVLSLYDRVRNRVA